MQKGRVREMEGGSELTFRHEWKHEINYSDVLTLRQCLRAVMKTDPHALNGVYMIRSLYFDNLQDKALREKLDGVNHREKFRIRYYNGDTSLLSLEKKMKHGDLTAKLQARITSEEAERLLHGDLGWMREASDRPLVQDLYRKMATVGLRPKTIVDYTREPFIYGPGNVRVTIDENIRTGLSNTDFLDWNCPTISVPDSPTILEVKWDAYLPDIIRDVVQVKGCHAAAYSKYAACRMYD